MLHIEEVKNQLRRKAVVFQTGGGRPGDNYRQSWIGKVKLGFAEEACPLDIHEQPMFPLMQLCLADLPFIPEALQNTKVLTVFISSDFLDDPGGNFCVREYSNLENLVEKDFGGSIEGVRPFPLFPKLIENDFPAWGDGEDISSDLVEIIQRKENEILHKIGGYANYCRASDGIEAGYEFVFQIVTDYKAGLEIGDRGNIYFLKNSTTNQWQAYWDDF